MSQGTFSTFFGHGDSFGNLKKIYRGCRNRLFAKGLVQGFFLKNDQILKSEFITRLCL